MYGPLLWCGQPNLSWLSEEDEVLGVGRPFQEEVSGAAGLEAGQGGQHQLGALGQACQLLPCMGQLHIPVPATLHKTSHTSSQLH